MGYADGYAWRLTGRAEALVRGRRVPVAGSVTMDMTLLDVTDTGAELGDEVVLLGRQGSEEIPARELAAHAGTISWEILCHLGLRLPRRYVRGGTSGGAGVALFTGGCMRLRCGMVNGKMQASQ